MAAVLLAVEDCLVVKNAPLAVALLLEGLATPRSLQTGLFLPDENARRATLSPAEQPQAQCVRRALTKASQTKRLALPGRRLHLLSQAKSVRSPTFALQLRSGCLR